jgi:DNA modification methylase
MLPPRNNPKLLPPRKPKTKVSTFSPMGNDLFGERIKSAKEAPLAKRFVIPPFSVLDARQGEWKKRKQAWIEFGIQGEKGRTEDELGFSQACKSGYEKNPCDAIGANENYRAKKRGKNQQGDCLKTGIGEKYGRKEMTGTSVFDPVLCELIYRWFLPKGGTILDPFAGECTKGIIAGALGHPYTGLELREEQVKENYRQAGQNKLAAPPKWIQTDSAKLNEVIAPEQQYDLIWTSPPYYDLEVYSNKSEDGSTKQTYEEFMEWYFTIFEQAVSHLRDNRFLAVKVGDVRDDDGCYRNFVNDNVSVFLRCGLRYYNEAILITAIGSLPIRVGAQFGKNRKLGKTHQNILIFFKGDPSTIKDNFVNYDKTYTW